MTSGDADPVDDPRLRFYLERRELIDEWSDAGLGESAFVDRYLLRLEEDLQEIADQEGADVSLVDISGDRLLALTRPAWPTTPYPSAAVALGWWPRSVRLGGLGRKYPWVGVRVRRSDPWSPLHQAVLGAISQDPQTISRFDERNKGNWPAYRWVPCEHDQYWEDLTPYRAELVDLVRTAWRAFSPLVDDAFGSLSS